MGGVLALMINPSKFVPERDIPDLTGKVVLVTGGNAGIGYYTVKELLSKNAKVYLAARSAEKAAVAIKSLEAETGKTAIFLQLDLGDLKSVRVAANTFLKQEERLDILFNNAGVLHTDCTLLTVQGLDLQFGTNVLGPFFFTELLLRALTKSFQQNQVPARVINTSSAGYTTAPGSGVEFNLVKPGPERDEWIKNAGNVMSGLRLYGQSKLGNIVVSNYWAKTHSDVLVSCAVHPGSTRAEALRHQPGLIRLIMHSYMYPTPMGALAQLWAGTVAKPSEITGQYVVPWGKVAEPEKRTKSAKLETEVIAFLKEQIQGF